MARKRRRFTAEFKARVALEALRERDSVQAIAAVIVTVPVLDVSPASIVSSLPLSVKSPGPAGVTAAAETVTVVGSLEGRSSVAVTVVLCSSVPVVPLSSDSSMAAGVSTRVTVGAGSSSVIVSVTPAGSVAPRSFAAVAANVTSLAGASVALSTAVSVTEPSLAVSPAGIVSAPLTVNAPSTGATVTVVASDEGCENKPLSALSLHFKLLMGMVIAQHNRNFIRNSRPCWVQQEVRMKDGEAMQEPQKMELTSMDVVEEKRDELKRCLAAAFPEVFSDGTIDFDQLKRVLGERAEPGKERFGLTWSGKAECMKIIQQPSVATLKPVRDESVTFDETQNLFIEGDNLEVLKELGSKGV